MLSLFNSCSGVVINFVFSSINFLVNQLLIKGIFIYGDALMLYMTGDPRFVGFMLSNFDIKIEGLFRDCHGPWECSLLLAMPPRAVHLVVDMDPLALLVFLPPDGEHGLDAGLLSHS